MLSTAAFRPIGQKEKNEKKSGEESAMEGGRASVGGREGERKQPRGGNKTEMGAAG
jgi:hypothetical protein